MFKTAVIKNASRNKDKRLPEISADEMDADYPEERTMPYFSIVPEQVLSDQRYLSLRPHEQGQFWRLVTHLLWRDKGRITRTNAIAAKLGMTVPEWNDFEKKLLASGLLVESKDTYHLIQPELRAQYLQTIRTNNAMRRNT